MRCSPVQIQKAEYKGPQSTISLRHLQNLEMSTSGHTSLYPPQNSVWQRCGFTARRPAFRRPKQRSLKTSKLVALRVARGQAPLFEWHREDRRKATIAGGQRVCLYKLSRHAGASARGKLSWRRMCRDILPCRRLLHDVMASAEQQIKQCNQDIEDNPDNAKAYLNRAICYMHLQNYEETLNDAMQSTKLNDASADAWYMLGQAHMGLGHYRAAISAFRRANQIDPANVHIRSAVLQAEQILEEVQQGKYAQATFSPGALNAGRNTA